MTPRGQGPEGARGPGAGIIFTIFFGIFQACRSRASGTFPNLQVMAIPNSICSLIFFPGGILMGTVPRRPFFWHDLDRLLNYSAGNFSGSRCHRVPPLACLGSLFYKPNQTERTGFPVFRNHRPIR